MFVEHVDFPNHAVVHRRMIYAPSVNSFSIANEITITVSTTDTGTLHVMMSRAHTTKHIAIKLLASGIALPGNTTTYTFTGLDRCECYYG